ncbi:hypothetical protein H4R33_007071, partial [Dimargaris cristalligena]
MNASLAGLNHQDITKTTELTVNNQVKKKEDSSSSLATEDESDAVVAAVTATDIGSQYKIHVLVNGEPREAVLDTGAQISVIPESLLPRE